MYMDKITEAIAHFVGVFEITVEQARLRQAYEEFKALQARNEEATELANHSVKVNANYAFDGFIPSVSYVAPNPELIWVPPWSAVSFQPPDIPIGLQLAAYPGFIVPELPVFTSPGRIVLPLLEPPGSIVAAIELRNVMSDNDYVGAGGHGLKFSPEQDHGAELAALIDAAATLSPIRDQAVPAIDEIPTFITTSADTLKEWVETSETWQGQATVFAHKASAIEGIYVNGQLVDELPDLDDYLPEDDDAEEEEEEEGEEDGGSQPSGQTGSVSISVEVEAGGNTVVNSVVLTNKWPVSGVVAVTGDHVEVNAIVQINAWCDADLVGSVAASWTLDPEAISQAFNIAKFERINPSSDDEAPQPIGDFPKHWVVTEIQGDLVMMNWIQQFNFMTDNDVCILSSSGAEQIIIAGDNTQMNGVSLQELGFYYDLIVIGGNIYDANLIYQTNILLDNDLIGAVDGFHTTGEGAVSTQGNLLWNQAGIINVGGGADLSAMPEHYRQAAENLKNGKHELNDGVLNDLAFAGIGTLRVLYISGDVLNLQYIKQTNILGDSDEVALAMSALQAHPEADWTISTGTNSLVNYAGILDLDSMGPTYVGGGIYSDEILIQAELISTSPQLGGQDPDMLVNEAVAFLDDSPASESAGSPPTSSLAPEPTYSDPMQSILA